MAHRWYVQKHARSFAATRDGKQDKDGKRERIMMHAEIAGKGCDHINRDGLDNRRSNLRPATKRQQSINRGLPSSNTSGHRGVHFHYEEGKRGGWIASINIDGKQTHLGIFQTIEEAITARRDAEIIHYGEFRPSDE